MAAIGMLSALIFAVLVCTNCLEIAKQNDCAPTCSPVTITVHGDVEVKDKNKPSAHIEAATKLSVTYQANHVIKDWSVSAPHSHLTDGMKYNDGKLTVPTPGRYYIYAQIYYQTTGRVNIRVNNHIITMIHPPSSGKTDHGTLSAGGVFNLNAGDVISVDAIFSITVYMDAAHSYFGAFLV